MGIFTSRNKQLDMYFSSCACCGCSDLSAGSAVLRLSEFIRRDIMEIPFVKLQGNGNDFVLIDEMGGTVIPEEMKGEFARLYCDRRFGIGADGVSFCIPLRIL